ncbi:hypothetical protein [Kitasatospora sp. NPDC006786]|uniref:hypothetical protein n=1 Tax=unclassified Kitasatospora TaxID=2633591 RepID=UPI0033F5ADA7
MTAYIALGLAFYCVSIYLAFALVSLISVWVGGPRVPGNWLCRLRPLDSFLRSIARKRAQNAHRHLENSGVSADELPDAASLERTIADRSRSLAGMGVIWAPPLVASFAMWLGLSMGDPDHHIFKSTAPLLPWGLLVLSLCLAETDRRAVTRSVPREWTVHAALAALEAIAEDSPERRGRTKDGAVSKTVGELCSTLERQARFVPKDADHVLRQRVRGRAYLIVRNVQAAKIRLLSEDAASRTDLARILASVLRHATRSANTIGATVKLADDDVLIDDPEWHRDSRPASTVAGVIGNLALVAALVAAGVTINLIGLPDVVATPIVSVITAAGVLALRRLRIPTTAEDTSTGNQTDQPGIPAEHAEVQRQDVPPTRIEQ